MRRLWCALAAGEGRIRIRATAFARLPMLRIDLTTHPVKPLQAKLTPMNHQNRARAAVVVGAILPHR
jgi:hypothetical protein